MILDFQNLLQSFQKSTNKTPKNNVWENHSKYQKTQNIMLNSDLLDKLKKACEKSYVWNSDLEVNISAFIYTWF